MFQASCTEVILNNGADDKLEGHSVECRYLCLAAWITNQGLRSTDEFQIAMKTSLSQCTSAVKFS